MAVKGKAEELKMTNCITTWSINETYMQKNVFKTFRMVARWEGDQVNMNSYEDKKE